MKKNTEKLLRDLAERLGTTTEKLYGVLVKQAKVEVVNSIISIIMHVGAIILCYQLIGIYHLSEGKIVTTGYSAETIYPMSHYLCVIFWILNGGVWLICFFGILDNIRSIVNNLINPEYGAVEQILNSMTEYVE